MVSNRCPRCNRKETWEHAILCESIEDMKVKYAKNLKDKINKVKRIDAVRNQIDMMLQDIYQYLMEGEEIEGHVIQSIVGMSQIFRGWIVKNWVDVQENQPRRTHVLNKLIIKQSVLFYAEAWKHRNKALHNPDNYWTHAIAWCNKVVESIESDNRPEMRKYLRSQRIDVDRCDSACMRYWILGANEMRKKTKREIMNDIRQYFAMRN